MPNHRAVISSERDPYWNLAAEEQLLAEVRLQGEGILFLWQSDPAVIIGKNQNPWQECNLAWMRDQGIHLARRISGGGAVYHDSGNLNYAIFQPRALYNADVVFDRTLAALQTLGIDAARMGRTSFSVAGRKISGHAFCMRRQAVMHHGTLLWKADIEALRESLRVPPGWTFETKATASVRAPVTNLSDRYPCLTLNDLQSALIHAWAPEAKIEKIDCQTWGSSLLPRQQELGGSAWLFERTPDFWLSRTPDALTAGEVSRWHVRGGIVRDQAGAGRHRSDWMGKRLPLNLEELLKPPCPLSQTGN